MGATVVLDPRLESLVDPLATPDQIASDCIFTEGPLWNPRDNTLTFSDVRGNTMYRWSEATGKQVIRKPSGVSNGNTFDRNGDMVTCEHMNRRVSRTFADGRVETLVDNFEGKRLHSPNDIVLGKNGDLYFTDPPYGLRQPDGTFAAGDMPFNGVYRIAASDGSLSLVVDDFERPNGLVLTDDGQHLLIDDTDRHHVRIFDLSADGKVSNGRVFADVTHGDVVGRPDGMKLDSQGNLYVTANTANGVWVYAPDGTLLGFIGVPEGPANCAWGGPDNRTLFITACTGVYRLRMKVAGQPIPLG
jgi:gluconolactonase